jgi:exoribonuclease-2
MLFPGSTSIVKHSLIGYNLHKGPAIAVVTNNSGNAVRVFIRNRKEFNIKSSTVFLMESSHLNDNPDEWVDTIEDMEEKVQSVMDSIELGLLHEMLLEEGKDKVSLPQILKFWYGDDYGFVQIMAFARILGEDHCYFKRKKDEFLVHDKEHVEAYFEQLERLRQKKEREERYRKLLDQNEPYTEEQIEQEESFFQTLKDIAIYWDRCNRLDKYIDILRDCRFHTKYQLRKHLIHTNILKEDTPFEIIESAYPTRFSEIFKIRLKNEHEIAKSFEVERDLTHLKSITVDGEKTEDRDDAISYDAESDKFYVHITNVAAWVNNHDWIESELKERLTSLYMPDNYYPMFPKSCAPEISLNEKKKCRVLTAEFKFNGNDVEYDIYPSIIRVHRNYSYNHFEDKKIERFQHYFQMADRISHWRHDNGAVTYRRPFELDFNLGESISIEPKYMMDSQGVIAEFSIMANYLFARFCSKKNIPIYYRSQKGSKEQLRKSPFFDEILDSFYHYYRLKRYWGRTRFELNTTCHFSLGLDYYTQMTSPMRRYVDYLNQKQLWHWFTEQSLLPEDELESGKFEISSSLYDYNGIQDRRKRHWLLKYFRQEIQKSSDGHFQTPAIVLEAHEDRVVLYLTDYCEVFRWNIHGEDLKQGDHATVYISHIDLVELESSGRVIT